MPTSSTFYFKGSKDARQECLEATAEVPFVGGLTHLLLIRGSAKPPLHLA